MALKRGTKQVVTGRLMAACANLQKKDEISPSLLTEYMVIFNFRKRCMLMSENEGGIVLVPSLVHLVPGTYSFGSTFF